MPTGNPSWIIFSGSLPPGIEPGFYADLIKKIKMKNPDANIALDTDGKELNNAIKSVPTVIKPNLYELERFTGTKIRNFSQLVKTGKTLIASGIKFVLVTAGKNGAVGFSEKGIFWSKPPAVKEKSSVGCGDVFLSGFLHKISCGCSFEESLKFAVACGTAKVKEEGTKMPFLCGVEKILKETALTPCRNDPCGLKKLFRRQGSE